jgi:hypothetical protein
MIMLRNALISAAVVVFAVASGSAAAQGRPGRQPQQPPAGIPAPDAPQLTAGEVQRWFDAYALVQAQEALQLSESQYGRFITRLKGVQETRRTHTQARNAILADLRRLTDPKAAPGDEGAIRERLRALRDETDRAAADLRKAHDAVDEVLDVRQQARFRLFEEQMERRKLELLMRARQNARARRGGGGTL